MGTPLDDGGFYDQHSTREYAFVHLNAALDA